MTIWAGIGRKLSSTSRIPLRPFVVILLGRALTEKTDVEKQVWRNRSGRSDRGPAPARSHFVREDDESMKPPSNVKTPAQYIASLPASRAKTIETVRALVNKHIPRGYDECLVWGTIGWTIPLSRYPDTYNKQPICYVALSSQKNYCSLYLMGAFWSASQLEQLKAAFKAAGKNLDMGKCCVHFESPDDLPIEGIGKLISAIPSEKWIEMYEQSRLMTKAEQARIAKQSALSASKVAAERVDTKRGRSTSPA
jgi:hypothetical protein